MLTKCLPAIALLTFCAGIGLCQDQAPRGDTSCTDGLSKYQGTKVGVIEVTSPFDFVPAVRSLLKHAKAGLPLKEGHPFDALQYSQGTEDIKTYIKALLPDQFTSVRLIAVQGAVEHCSKDSIDVRYRVLTAVIPRSPGRLPEIAASFIETPASSGGSFAIDTLLGLIPNLNYNHTRQVFGGVAIDRDVKMGIFDHFSATPLVSPNSTTGSIVLSGSANPAHEYLDKVSWRLGDDYYDVRAGSDGLTKALLGIQFFSASKELRSTYTLRFGAEIGGGHVQDATHFSLNSSYGEAKILTGVEIRRAQLTAAGSYGFEAGVPFSASTGVFEKHIFDARFAWTYSPLPEWIRSGGKSADDRLKFIGAVHRPLSVEGQFNAGFFSGSSQIPSVERFLGGNQKGLFIPGQNWDMQAQPFIRSISENQLGLDTGVNAVGGTRFYSSNWTLGKAVWGKSLMPQGFLDKEFLGILDGGMNTARGELSDSYFSKDPRIKSAPGLVVGTQNELESLKEKVAKLPSPLQSVKAMKDFNLNWRGALETAKSIANGRLNSVPRLIHTNIPAVEKALIDLAAAATNLHDQASADDLGTWRSSLDEQLHLLETGWAGLNIQTVRNDADAWADQDLAPAKHVLNSIFYQLNVYSISPVVSFDIARVWPEQHGTRLGIGGGVRLSLVNANFTAGYAGNPTRAGTEGPGAFFFSLDYTNLFR
jgi:hypothetical protein